VGKGRCEGKTHMVIYLEKKKVMYMAIFAIEKKKIGKEF
jgi:hypothetical protein